MKIRSLTPIIIIGFIVAFSFHFIVLAAIDAPHNESSNINCGSCHGQGLLNSPFWGGSMSYDQLCLNCHTASSGPYTETNAPLVKTHSSENTSENYGVWLWECRNCHDAHYQKQKNYKNTDAGNLYLATGIIDSCSYNDVANKSTLTYTSINYKAGWDATRLLEKTSEYRRAILFPNVNKLGYSYPVVAIDTPIAGTIVVLGDARPVYQYITESTFAMMYGQYVKDNINDGQVKFLDQTGSSSFADGDTIYNGVCEVCHTFTDHYRYDGNGGDQNHANVRGADGTNCISCHKHVDGFGHSTGTGTGCEACHGQDGGAGTTQSHSTHTENDADDIKGPSIMTCDECHDTNNYPNFQGIHYYKEITIQSSKVEADLTNFPMLFKTVDPDLKTTANGGHVTNANGYDIVFTDSNGNQLAHEIEKYDRTTGEFIAWVKIPSLSSTTDTVIRIGYNKSNVTISQENVDGVWDNSFEGVWHLKENPTVTAPQMKDSTINGRHGTTGGISSPMTPADQVTGKVNGALNFDRPDRNVVDFGQPSDFDIQGDITVEMWFKADSFDNCMFFLTKEPSTSGYGAIPNINVSCYLPPPTEYHIQYRRGNESEGWGTTSLSAINTGQWYYLACTASGPIYSIYLNGNLDISTDLTGQIGTLTNSSNKLRLGGRYGDNMYPGYFFDGYLDEVRISNTARSAEWIKTSYNNQSSPSAFYTVGAEQNAAPIDLATTPVCDKCHSPGGAFDGVTMAKANWDNGVYKADGKTLKSGKEKWCASCHDTAPANSKRDGTGIIAPYVVGDNSTWGFYATGHGRNASYMVECLDCHDASKTHIDHNHRTYEVTNDGNFPITVVNPYGDSYRLRDIDGQPALNIPVPFYSSGDAYIHRSDYRLCWTCHIAEDVLGTGGSDLSISNFWNINDPHYPRNSHNMHVSAYSNNFDSDWDGLLDSPETCISCHNVHGSPTQAMIRHGELIQYYTGPKVPALNFTYLVPSTDPPATATWTPNIPTADTYYVYAWWSEHSNRATNAPYTIYYDGGSDTIRVNQRNDGGQWNYLGTYAFASGTSGSVVLSNSGVFGYVIADAIGLDSDGVFGVDPEIVVDNPSATFVGTWDWAADADTYGADLRYHAAPEPIEDPSSTVDQSFGGKMRYGWRGIGSNKVCTGCHPPENSISYFRMPKLGPRFLGTPKVDPDIVPNDGSGFTLITAGVRDPDGDFSTMKVNLSPIGGSASQQMYDDGDNIIDGNGSDSGDEVAGDRIYSYLATIATDTSDGHKNLVITATDSASNSVQQTVILTVFDPDFIYVDNTEAILVCGDWYTSTGVSGAYNDDLCWKWNGTGSCTATWRPTLTQAGNYKVYALWIGGGGARASNAPYTINYDGGSQTFRVDQEPSSNGWYYFGTFNFAAGTSGYVTLSDDADGIVIADAIKFEPVP